MIDKILDRAATEAMLGSSNGSGGPFGAVITDSNGNIISVGHNKVLETHDPTNHAEVVAIREACKKLNTHDLSEYTIYSSCEPCPMCLSAIIWSNIKKVYYATTRYDVEKIGFKDSAIYDYFENKKSDILEAIQIPNEKCTEVVEKYRGDIY